MNHAESKIRRFDTNQPEEEDPNKEFNDELLNTFC